MGKLTINTSNLTTCTPLGTDFEAHSPEEVSALVRSGVHPSRILYADHRQTAFTLRFAARAGVDAVVAGEHEDLVKIACHHPRARVVLRVNASQSPYDREFRDASAVASDLLEEARSLGLNVAGVRFHVGSDTEAYEVYTDSKNMTAPVHMRSPVYLRSPDYSRFANQSTPPLVPSRSPRVAVK